MNSVSENKTMHPYSFANYLDEQARSAQHLRKGERTRHRLLAAAARILDRKGYRDMQIGEVAEEAGHSVGGIYVHFKNKQDLVLEVLSSYISRNFAASPRFEEELDAFTRLYLTNLYYVHLFGANVGLMRCVRQLSDDVPEFSNLWLESNARWHQLIAAGIRRTSKIETPDGDVSYFVAHALGNMIDEFLHDLYIRNDSTLQSIREVPEESALTLSIIWYRSIWLKSPSPKQIRDATECGERLNREVAIESESN